MNANKLGIFNLYNRKNSYYYYYEREKIIKYEQGDGGYHSYAVDGNIKIYQQNLYPFIPSISYSFKF